MINADADRPSSANDYERFKQTKRFVSLDGLRAISIAAVVWHHTAGARGDVVFFGQFRGVEIFFAISGFVITTLLLRERERTGGIDLRRFFRNRALRTFPLYFTVLGVYVVLVTLLEAERPGGRQFFANLPYFLTHTSNWFIDNRDEAIFGFSWSLAAQEQFYATWPVMLTGLPVTLASGAIALVAIVAASGDLRAVHDAEIAGLSFIVRHLPFTLLFSAALACVAHGRRSFRSLHVVAGHRICAPVVAVLLALALLNRMPPLLLHLLEALLIVSCALRDDHVLATVLSSPRLVSLGALSYGVYLMHGLVYNVVQEVERAAGLHALRTSLVEFAIVLAVTFVAARLSFEYYEAWFLRLRMPSLPERRLTPAMGIARIPDSGV
jgi:peptidoglycan/LPS O-acetylase OafA/YrhL